MLDHRLRFRVDEVERLAVTVGQVREVVHRLGDVVHRHHVGVAEVDAGHRQPGRQVVAHQLHQREDVVGAVDLVHRAGLGVADHDRGPVDPPRDLCLLADDLLRLVLGPVVRRGQVLALVEHRLVEDAVVLAGRGHRGHLVEAAHLQRLRELEGVPGAPDVQRLVGRVVGGHVVDRREMEEVVDALPAAVLLDPVVGHAEPVRRQVADHGDDPVAAPGPDERLHPSHRRRTAEHEDRALAVVDELLHEVPADEPRGAGHEVRHGRRLPAGHSGGEGSRVWDAGPLHQPLGDGCGERERGEQRPVEQRRPEPVHGGDGEPAAAHVNGRECPDRDAGDQHQSGEHAQLHRSAAAESEPAHDAYGRHGNGAGTDSAGQEAARVEHTCDQDSSEQEWREGQPPGPAAGRGGVPEQGADHRARQQDPDERAHPGDGRLVVGDVGHEAAQGGGPGEAGQRTEGDRGPRPERARRPPRPGGGHREHRCERAEQQPAPEVVGSGAGADGDPRRADRGTHPEQAQQCGQHEQRSRPEPPVAPALPGSEPGTVRERPQRCSRAPGSWPTTTT